jgi:phosphoribosylformimino-5-aminoimidazole carboxamide ribotide isomerase
VFRPCIDLHEGKVKQIVGGSLSDSGAGLRTNFVSEKSAAWFAELYRRDELKGGHVIQLGSGNEAAARAALAVFRDGRLDWDRLKSLVAAIGKERLVLDLSCRVRDGKYFVVTDRWQKFTDLIVNAKTLQRVAAWCSEFLIHAVDVEGLCRGVDLQLVKLLGDATPIPATYAGGARSLEDLQLVTREGNGRVDLTIGSALDIFGGNGVRYEECVAFNRQTAASAT